MISATRWVLACVLSAGLAAPAGAQEVTARATADGVEVSGRVTLPDACWSVGALGAGAPEGAPEIGNAVAVTLALEHDAGAMCAQMLVEASFDGTVAAEGDRPYVVLYFAAPEGSPPNVAEALIAPVK